MESNWNGLFLSEPRFRLAVIFAVTGVFLQVGLWLINTNWITSVANIIFIVVLRVIFATADNVMHPPPSPIFNSGNLRHYWFLPRLDCPYIARGLFLDACFLDVSKIISITVFDEQACQPRGRLLPVDKQ